MSGIRPGHFHFAYACAANTFSVPGFQMGILLSQLTVTLFVVWLLCHSAHEDQGRTSGSYESWGLGSDCKAC